jgi:hypothetical protein
MTQTMEYREVLQKAINKHKRGTDRQTDRETEPHFKHILTFEVRLTVHP